MKTNAQLNRLAEQIKQTAWNQTFWDFRGPEETDEAEQQRLRELTDDLVSAPNRMVLYYQGKENKLFAVVGKGAAEFDVVLYPDGDQPDFLYCGADRNRLALKTKKLKNQTFTSSQRNGAWTLA